MLDATRMTKLARAVAAWTLRGAHSGAALVGVAVIGLAAMQVSRHGVEGLQPSRIASDYGFVAQADAEPAQPEGPVAAVSPTFDGVVRYLSQKYRVSGTAVTPLVQAAQHVGRSMGVDPPPNPGGDGHRVALQSLRRKLHGGPGADAGDAPLP